LKKKGKGPVKEIFDAFISRYPEYQKDPGRVYDVAARMLQHYDKKK